MNIQQTLGFVEYLILLKLTIKNQNDGEIFTLIYCSIIASYGG